MRTQNHHGMLVTYLQMDVPLSPNEGLAVIRRHPFQGLARNLQQGGAEEPGNPVIPASALQLGRQEILQRTPAGRVALDHKAIWLFPRSATEIFSGTSIMICLVIMGYPCINDEANKRLCFIVCSMIASDAIEQPGHDPIDRPDRRFQVPS